MKTKLSIYALAALTLINETQAQSRADNAVPVNPDNFIRPRPIIISPRWSRMEVSANSPITEHLGRSKSRMLS